MSLGSDLANSVRESERSLKAFGESVHAFIECCQRYDWAGAENCRTHTMAVMDRHFDAMAALYKRLESVEK